MALFVLDICIFLKKQDIMSKKTRENAKKVKQEMKNFAAALRSYTELKTAAAWPVMTDEIRSRLEMEYDWFGRNGLAKGMLELKRFMDAAHGQPMFSFQKCDGFLAGSAVAYCLGMTAEDPIAAGRMAEEFKSDFENRYLNVRLYFDLDTRNAMISLADGMFQEPSKLRLGVPVIRLDRIYLEFRRI